MFGSPLASRTAMIGAIVKAITTNVGKPEEVMYIYASDPISPYGTK